MSQRLSTTDWKSIKPALFIGLALALLQIGSGLATYHQSKNILWEGKFQTAQNLTHGLVVAVADQVVLKDYAGLESRIAQTMSNEQVASALLTDLTGKVLTHLQRDTKKEPRLIFEPSHLTLPDTQEATLQVQDAQFITTWNKVSLGQDLGWARVQTYSELDNADLVGLRQQTLILSALSVVSGILLLGIFLWRSYFVVVQREHQIEVKLDEATQRLMQSEKLASLGELAAGVAHEINNPVGYVSSNLHTLKKYLGIFDRVLDAPEVNTSEMAALKQKHKYAFIREEVHALMNETLEGLTRVKIIIQDLKDYARTNASTNYVSADIHVGLKSILNIARNQLKHRADVHLSLGNLPMIECSPSQIDQVFLNLIVNAAQAMPEGKQGLIHIKTDCNEEQAWIEVQDNGSGMTAAVLEKIFDPFFTTKGPGKGTGLGLSVSHSIIQQHGGTLSAISTVGVGTTFKITLPIKRHVAQG